MTRYSGSEFLEILEEAKNYNLHIQRLIEEYVIEPSKTKGVFVDFGSGSGEFAKRLLKLRLEVVCVEIDDNLRQTTNHLGIKTFSDLGQIEDSSINGGYSVNVFEHIANDGEALELLVSKMKSGARLLVWVPAGPALFSKFDSMVGHHRRYTKKTLRNLLDSDQVSLLTVQYADSLGFLAAGLWKLMRRSTPPSSLSVRAYDKLVFPLSRAVDTLSKNFFGKNLFAVIEVV